MKDEKRFIKKAMIFVFTFILILSLYSSLVLHYSSTPGLTKWVHESYKIKDAAVKKSPKLVILAGSNALFGISAKEIEKELGIPSLNYAVHAGLEDYMFERVKKIANPGDIILLPLEYEHYWYEKKIAFGKQTIRERYILTHDQEYYESLNFFERLNLILIGIEDLILNIRYQDKSGGSPYDAKTINQWGDETNNLFENKKDFQHTRIVFPEQFSENFESYHGVKYIREFVQWAEKNDVTLIASFPSTIYFPEYEEMEEFTIIEDFYRDLGVTVLGKPEDFFYNPELFYDTRYHLTNVGMEKRTSFIIGELVLEEKEGCSPIKGWWC